MIMVIHLSSRKKLILSTSTMDCMTCDGKHKRGTRQAGCEKVIVIILIFFSVQFSSTARPACRHENSH